MSKTYNRLKPAYEMVVSVDNFDDMDKDLFERLYPNYDERIMGLLIFLRENKNSMFR